MPGTSLQPHTRRWLNWEWRAALITVIGGVIVALAIIAYLTYRTSSQEAAQAQARARQVAVIRTAALLCKQALVTAKSFGIVPNYAVLTSVLPSATQVTGRYVCSGGTNVSRYVVAVDLLCRDLKSPRCLALYSVTQQDGTVLYRRQH